MAALYKILDEYRAQVAQLQDIDLPAEVVLDTIEGMQGELTEKIKAVLIVAMEMDAEAATRAEHAKRMSESAKAAAGRAEGLRSYAQLAIQNSGLALPIKYPEFDVTLKKNPLSCTVTDAAKLLPSLRKTTLSMTLPSAVSATEFLDLLTATLMCSPFTAENQQAISSSVQVTDTADKAAVLRALKVVETQNATIAEADKKQHLEGAYINPTGYRLAIA